MQIVEILILELIFIIISLVWSQGGSILFGHDSAVSLIPIHHWISLLYSWNPSINFGYAWSQVYTRAFLFTYAPETIFYMITRNIYIAQHLSYLFCLSIMGLGMYIYVSDIFSSAKFRLIRIFSPILYVVNFYILQAWLIDERTKFSLYAALPIGLVLIRRMLRQEHFNLRYPIYMALLFLLLSGGGQPPYYGSILIAYPLYFVVELFISSNLTKNSIWRSIVYATLSVGLILLINAYFLTPYVFDLKNLLSGSVNLSSGLSTFIAWEREISKNASVVNLFRLQGIPDWYANPAHPYSNQFILKRSFIFFSFIPILVILTGLCLTNWNRNEEKDRKKEILFLLVLLCVGIIFAGGTHAPFGQLYLFAMEHIPGFVMFRSSFYKFAPLVWFPVSVLFGYFLVIFSEYLLNKKLKILFGIVVCAGILAYHYPYFSTTAFDFRPGFSTRLKIPGYTLQMSKDIEHLVASDGRVLLYPPLDSGYIGSPLDTYKWGYYSLDPMPRMISDRSMVANDAYGHSVLTENAQQALHDGDSLEFLRYASISGITHVLWRGDVKRSDAMNKDIPFTEMESRLSTMSALSKVVSVGPWTLYSITGKVLPMVYAINSQKIQRVSYIQKNPTLYRVDVSQNNFIPFTLVFNQQFDAGWRATAYTKVGATVVLNKHSEVNSFANTWMVNQVDIDHINLEYTPQRYFYFGLVVSGVTIIGMGFYLVKSRKRSIIRKRLSHEN